MNACLPATFCVSSCNLHLFFRDKYSLSFRVQTRQANNVTYKTLNFSVIKNVPLKHTRLVLSRTWYSVLRPLDGKKKNPSARRKIDDLLQNRDFFMAPARELNLSAWHRRGKVLNHIYRVFTNCWTNQEFSVLFYVVISLSCYFLFPSRESASFLAKLYFWNVRI